jgi:putative nucleotidyltransferase with HDIG domain
VAKRLIFSEKMREIKIGSFFLPEFAGKIAYFIALVIIVPLMFPSGRSFKYTDMPIGSVASKKVIAPFDFSVLKPETELENERLSARDKIPFFFTLNDTIPNFQISRFRNFLSNVRDADQQAMADTTSISFEEKIEQALANIAFQTNIAITQEDFQNLYITIRSESFSTRQVINILTELYVNRLINLAPDKITNQKVILISDGIEEEIEYESLIDIRGAAVKIQQAVSELDNPELWARVMMPFVRPYVYFNPELTDERRREAVASVPIAKDIIKENQRIVDANDLVTEEVYQKLYSLEYATAEKSAVSGEFRTVLSLLAKYLLTGLILSLFVIYLSANRRKIFHDNKKLGLITLIIFLQVGFGAIIIGPLGWPEYVVPTTIASMLLGMLFDTGVGFVGTVIIALLLGGISGFDYFYIMMTLFVGLIAIYSVTHIRTRNQIFKAILFIIFAYVLSVFTFGVLRYEHMDEILEIIAFYILPNAILSPLITYMILGVFERLFDITTDITLLELSDLNHPLLKELSIKAPGTFHHSIIVGNLSESAAISIGANSLMARVGSYYHDIGKMIKPEYFVENQQSGENKHENLAPNMSAIILSSHVKNGLEMAENHKLPKIIRDFIPEHHGRNLMPFFYKKALDSKEITEVNESDYRYPGPSPQSRETAIVMLADTVEAATKALANPSAGRIRKTVEELVEKRFLEGELDDSNLTMRDLKGIIDGFVSVLLGIYHKRIEYPKTADVKKVGTKQAQKEKANKVANNGN